MRRSVIVLLFVLFASTAHAQSLKIPTIVFAGAASTDITQTRILLNDPEIHEVNWLYKHFDGHPNVQVAATVGVDIGTIWLMQTVARRGHPKVATIALYTLASLRAFAVIRNVQRTAR